MTLLNTFEILLTSYINIFTPEDTKIMKVTCRNGMLFSLHSYAFIATEHLRSRIGTLLTAISTPLLPKKLLIVKVAYPR